MFSLFSHFNQAGHAAARGFGLIELLVSISLMVLVLAIVLVQQTAFNGSVLLRSQAFEIALQIREVQLNAVSVAAATDAGTGQVFRAAYGVHFNTGSGSNQLFTIYRDIDNDGWFDSGEAFGAQGILDQRFEIREVRRVSGSTQTVQSLISILFQRPNFDARFFTASGVRDITTDSVQIDIARKGITGTGSGVVRTIEVTSAGQIAVLE